MRVGEVDASAGESVDVGSRDKLRSIDADVAKADVVAVDNNDVRSRACM